jgi:hypothetical protein
LADARTGTTTLTLKVDGPALPPSAFADADTRSRVENQLVTWIAAAQRG